MPEQDRFALDVIRKWPDAAREAAYNVLLAHGAPDQLDDTRRAMGRARPVEARRRVRRGRRRDPDDVVESVIDATIPDAARGAVDEVATDWHVHVEDDGEIAVRGPDLKINALTLNVVHSMVTTASRPNRAAAPRPAAG